MDEDFEPVVRIAESLGWDSTCDGYIVSLESEWSRSVVGWTEFRKMADLPLEDVPRALLDPDSLGINYTHIREIYVECVVVPFLTKRLELEI
jgi:hypothetical protein